jgi:tetratricopeptide (TPR) repeat protein
MKYVILAVFGAGMAIGSMYYANRANTVSAVTRTSTEAARAETARVGAATHAPVIVDHSANPAADQQPQPKPDSKLAVSPVSVQMDKAAINESVDILLSSQATHDQKQAAWKALRESGGLDVAISDLQQRLANNPANAESAAVLGHAYLQKCGTISDVRDQGVLAMQADKLFDTALGLDPQNWEARFTKAVALSYSPASMGKSDEVIQHFLTLIQQQETQPAQPQFAETYAWLGDQYQKAGRNEDAHNVWARGAALYPDNQKLSGRLASNP